MQQKSFEEALKGQTEEFTLIPRMGLWKDIEKELVPEKKRRVALWLWWPIGLLLIGSSATLFYYQYFNKEKVNTIASSSFAVHPEIPLSKKELPLTQTDFLVATENKRNHFQIKAKAKTIQSHQNKEQLGESPFNASLNVFDLNNIQQNDFVFKGQHTMKDVTIISKRNAEQFPAGNQPFTALTDSLKANLLSVETKDSSMEPKSNIVPTPAIPKRRIFVGFTWMPTFSGSLLTMPKNTGSPSDYAYRKNTDKYSLQMGAGIQAGMQSGKHRFSVGLQYQQLGYKIFVQNVERVVSTGFPATLANSKFYATDSFQPAPNGSGVYVTNSFKYLSLPLGYSYQVMVHRRISLGLTGTMAFNAMVGSKALLLNEPDGYYVRQNSSVENHLLKYNMLLSSGVDINYVINSKCSFFIKPVYGISLRPVEQASVRTYHQYWGFGLGLNWFLK